MSRLNDNSLGLLRRNIGVSTFAYDRHAQKTGIVHFGIGAFHRAHQAWYTDRAMSAGERDWAIAGVSLRSPAVMAQLNPQDGLYTVTEQGEARSHATLIGAIREVLVADRHAASIVDRIAAPACHILSLTVTEKGYCRAADGSLDHCLAGPGSIYRFLTEGLARRRDAALPGLTLLSCDNLTTNGQQLERLVADYCAQHDPALGEWIARHCTFPATMVDRIVPATTPADLDAVQHRLDGIRDEGAVVTEPFSQWVIEDRFAGPRPRWEAVGAQLVSDVTPYETAKLRMLNGAHSALAYLGLERGHTFVHQAIDDPALRPLIERLMRQEAATSFIPGPGQDLAAYADALLARFANPALNHRLAQIAMDGSQKIPQRWLATLAAHQDRGQSCPAILAAMGAWLRHLRGDNGPVDDPRAAELQAAARTDDPARAIFGPGGILASTWHPGETDLATIAILA